MDALHLGLGYAGGEVGWGCVTQIVRVRGERWRAGVECGGSGRRKTWR